MRFEWDDKKEEANIRKHGIDFLRQRLCSMMRTAWIFMMKFIPRVKIGISQSVWLAELRMLFLSYIPRERILSV